jgi:hypothetical protein
MNLKTLKEDCEIEMFIDTDTCLKLIEIIEQQQRELDQWKEKEKWFMNAINTMYKKI